MLRGEVEVLHFLADGDAELCRDIRVGKGFRTWEDVPLSFMSRFAEDGDGNGGDVAKINVADLASPGG